MLKNKDENSNAKVQKDGAKKKHFWTRKRFVKKVHYQTWRNSTSLYTMSFYHVSILRERLLPTMK